MMSGPLVGVRKKSELVRSGRGAASVQVFESRQEFQLATRGT